MQTISRHNMFQLLDIFSNNSSSFAQIFEYNLPTTQDMTQLTIGMVDTLRIFIDTPSEDLAAELINYTNTFRILFYFIYKTDITCEDKHFLRTVLKHLLEFKDQLHNAYPTIIF